MDLARASVMITNDPGHAEGFDYLGRHRYSLIFRTDAGRLLFTDAHVVGRAVRQLLRASAEQRFSVIAYCFMPDHVHLFVEGWSDDSDGRRFIDAFRQYSSADYSQTGRGNLWQRHGFEHVLAEDDSTVEVVRYILRSPVREGLAASTQDYPFMGSMAYVLKDLINIAFG